MNMNNTNSIKNIIDNTNMDNMNNSGSQRWLILVAIFV